MSLKTFHIFFILLSIALAFGFGFWGIRDYSVTGNVLNRGMGLGALAGGIILTAYLAWFFSKMRKIESL